MRIYNNKVRDGHFEYWHVPSMKKLFTIAEPENSLHCCDFSKSGDHFATAGKDANIRIYD
jgi:WD40 repeat protein